MTAAALPRSRARVTVVLLALALGGFSIGATEFVAMGLLPNIAADLLPGLWRVSHAKADASAGLLVTGYAIGVVVGAPTIAVFAARFPRRSLLLTLLVWMVVGTLASALLPAFGAVFAARVFAGLPHGAYFGVASLVAAEVLGPGNRGRATAFVLGGLSVSNVIGVPAITLLGQVFGWRTAYLVVAVLFAITAVGVALLVPRLPGDPAATPRNELAAFAKPLVWLTLGIGAIGCGGFFAAYSYIAPLITNVTGLPSGAVPDRRALAVAGRAGRLRAQPRDRAPSGPRPRGRGPHPAGDRSRARDARADH